jgi:hypothetical protein
MATPATTRSRLSPGSPAVRAHALQPDGRSRRRDAGANHNADHRDRFALVVPGLDNKRVRMAEYPNAVTPPAMALLRPGCSQL